MADGQKKSKVAFVTGGGISARITDLMKSHQPNFLPSSLSVFQTPWPSLNFVEYAKISPASEPQDMLFFSALNILLLIL